MQSCKKVSGLLQKKIQRMSYLFYPNDLTYMTYQTNAFSRIFHSPSYAQLLNCFYHEVLQKEVN